MVLSLLSGSLLDLDELTDLINGCASDDLVRNSFVILGIVATTRYLHLKAQELHDALISAHTTIGGNLEEKIRLCDQGPDIEASAQLAALLTDQLAAISTKHQQARAEATFNEGQAQLNQLRGQLGLAQQDLIRSWMISFGLRQPTGGEPC